MKIIEAITIIKATNILVEDFILWAQQTLLNYLLNTSSQHTQKVSDA